MARFQDFLYVVVAFLGLSVVEAGASTVTFKLSIDGDDSPVQVLEPGDHVLRIEVKVTENPLIPANPQLSGGLLSVYFDLVTSTERFFRPTNSGFLGSPQGSWLSTWNDSFDVSIRGQLSTSSDFLPYWPCCDIPGSDSLGQGGIIYPENYNSRFNAVGANEYSLVAKGMISWDAQAADTIDLVVLDPGSSDVLVAALEGNSIVSAIPDNIVSNRILLVVPEPSALSLICIATLSKFRIRRRKTSVSG